MSVARFASRNARAIALGVVLLTAAGFYSMSALPSSIYPEVEFPRIVIVAKAGDLSPRLMQLAVTRPLEEAARAVLGVRRVRSKTIRGATEISVLFNPDADMRYALQLMQGKTDEVKPTLPAGTEMQVERMTPSIFPIFMFNLTGNVPPRDLRDLAVFDIRPLLSRVPGVANVEVLASEEREISVLVDPERLSAVKVSLDQVAEALDATNQVNSVARLAKDYRQYLVLATAELTSLDDVRNVVVAFRQQSPVYVRDVAEVREGVLDKTTLVSGDGQPAALVSVARQIRGNIIDVVDGARAAIEGFSGSLPTTVRWKVVYDLAEFVKAAVASVRDAIVIGSLLAIFVLIGFLRDWRVTFIAATSLPLTLVGTFWILHLAGGTIDLMSLGGLAIAIGLVIDDAIVIVENIHRHRALGETVAVAAEKGTQELIAAVTGSTLTTVVVFVPLGLLQGVVGQFFAALSLTLAAAVLLSLVYALLFIPNAAMRVLRDAPGAHSPAAGRPGLSAHYQTLMRRALARPGLVVLVTVAFGGLGVFFYSQLETGFLPEMDEGGFVLDYWTPTGTSLPETDKMVGRIEKVLHETPEVLGFARRTGAELGLFATPQNTGDIVVRLKPRFGTVEEFRGGHRGSARDLREGHAGHDGRVRAAPAGHAGRPRRQPGADRGEDLRGRPPDAGRPCRPRRREDEARRRRRGHRGAAARQPRDGRPDRPHARGESRVHRGAGVEPARHRPARKGLDRTPARRPPRGRARPLRRQVPVRLRLGARVPADERGRGDRAVVGHGNGLDG